MKLSWKKLSNKLSKITAILPPLPDSLKWVKPILGITLAVSAGVISIRQFGAWEGWELMAFDQLTRISRADFLNDDIMIIEITEEDLQRQKQWPLSDEILFELLSKLEEAEPVAIGLDIYRDLPVEPGHEKIARYFQTSDRIVPICQIGTSENIEIPPPSSIPQEEVPEVVGFPDLMVDSDGVVRRGLLFLGVDPDQRCNTPYSLSFQVARKYLEKKEIFPELTEAEQLQLGNTIFHQLTPNAGGYFQANTEGYQILLRYSSVVKELHTLTLDDILNDRYDPNILKNKMLFVGSTARSLKDTFYTPYSGRQREGNKTPGVYIHAQLASQIVDAAQNPNKLFWFFPDWIEIVSIIIFSGAAAAIAYKLRQPRYLILAEAGLWVILLGGTLIIFSQKGWLPIVAPGMGLLASSIGMIIYTNYEAEQKQKAIEAEKKAIALKAQEQTQNIALLQALLREKYGSHAEAVKSTEVLTRDDQTFQQQVTSISDETTELLPTTQPVSQMETQLTQPLSQPAPIQDRVPTISDSLPLLANRYQVTSVLGSGGFSATYLAKDLQRPSEPICVVKQLRITYSDDEFLEIARRLFKTEAEILDQVGHHPQIPNLLAHFEQDQQFYLIQEYIEGELFSKELKAKTTLSEKEVIIFLKQVLEVLAYIHDYGVIHRDIKPANIIKSVKLNKFVLIDFGAVKQMQPQDFNDPNAFTVAIGTKGYIPPEQYAGHPQLSSDIYALGMTAIEALTGTPPYRLEMNRKTGCLEWQHLVSIRGDLFRILDKMVRYHFNDRYQSADLVLDDLTKIIV
jgi:CHASE2 domain-containing sensor protein/tRNA A-37 threonylcarbamoyl transferase component Bud32